MTWSATPMPHETCSCGAEFFVSTPSARVSEVERASFREAHAKCRRQQAAEHARYRAALLEIVSRPQVERNPDGVDQAAATMKLIAREALDA